MEKQPNLVASVCVYWNLYAERRQAGARAASTSLQMPRVKEGSKKKVIAIFSAMNSTPIHSPRR